MGPGNGHASGARDYEKNQLPAGRQYYCALVGRLRQPSRKSDWWNHDGFARYSERATWKARPAKPDSKDGQDMSVGALA